MKKRMSICLAALLALGSITLFSGCSTKLRYENANQYTAGGATLEQSVSDLDIEWLAGDVQVVFGDVENVTFSETSDDALTESTTLHYWVQNGTLRIKYAKSEKGFMMGSYPEKSLVVTLPSAVQLNEVEIETVSAEVEISGAQISDLDIGTVSGNVNATALSVQALNVETVSGEVRASGQIGSFDIETVSGNLNLAFDNTPADGSIDSVSGDCTLAFSENGEGFAIEWETVSGKFNTDLVMTSKPAKEEKGRYCYMDGAHEYEIETVSGNLYVKKLA